MFQHACLIKYGATATADAAAAGIDDRKHDLTLQCHLRYISKRHTRYTF